LKLGQRVQRARFGDGVVLRIDGHGQGAQVEVNFERAGRKVLMAAYANYSPSEDTGMGRNPARIRVPRLPA
jgi:DNA helicase-2/ATP-dependent DNA helicase PcrA